MAEIAEIQSLQLIGRIGLSGRID